MFLNEVLSEACMIRLVVLLSILGMAPVIHAQEDFDPLDPSDDDAQMGIEVGTKIPEFRAVDQNGKMWDFDALKGPKGAVLVFHRSADW
jgi:hypothetical protein